MICQKEHTMDGKMFGHPGCKKYFHFRCIRQLKESQTSVVCPACGEPFGETAMRNQINQTDIVGEGNTVTERNIHDNEDTGNTEGHVVEDSKSE